MKKVYKVSVNEHVRLVNHAKSLVAKYVEAKWDICEIAIKLCFIKDTKGGRVPKGAYTITDFADEISINRKTLSCWILDYMVYKKLKIDIEGMNLSEAKRASSAITRTRTALLNMNKMSRSDLATLDNKKVQEKFESIIKEDAVTTRLKSFIKYSQHQLYTLSHETFEPHHHELLEELNQLIDKVSKSLKKALKGL